MARKVAETPTNTIPAVHGQRRRLPTGNWYFAVVILSAGTLAWIPFTHAASRLHRRDIRTRALAYALGALLLAILAALTPQDAHGNPVGATGRTLSTIVGTVAIALVVAGCYQLIGLRKAVYGVSSRLSPTFSEAAADPVVAAYLAARVRRGEARSLAQSDPAPHDLGIGRPDLESSYDDGGLIDLNSAPPATIANACSLEPAVAERITAIRQKFGSFSSLDEVLVFANVEGGAAARIRDYGALLPI